MKLKGKINLKKNFITLNINNYDYFFEAIVTIYQALLEKGWYIPRFCYHVKLSLAGNCRMCFVELENIGKPIISCATLISNDLKVSTSTALVFKAREGILEFLLINHPIDCPVCDQGSECDLQDQYIVMGASVSRYYEHSKKSINNKNLSFLIKLSLNKCINCTRCTRYSHHVIGDYSFSMLGRGENSVISSYINTIFIGEITGNVMDLCPVGALTSKLISYDFRIWELIDIKYVDFLDVMHPPIRIDFRGLKILRILPLSNVLIQEEWISDKIRYNFKSFFKNRFFLPYLKKNKIYIRFSWSSTISILKNLYIKIVIFYSKKKNFYIKNFSFCDNTLDLYKFVSYKQYFKKFSFFNDNFLNKKKYNVTRNHFLLKNKDLDFLKIDNFIFYNTNLRYELPLLNYKIREKLSFDYINVFLFGPILELNYIFTHFGNSLHAIISNLNKIFLVNFEKTIFFYGLNDFIFNTVFFFLTKLEKKINFYNINDLNNKKIFNNEFNSQKNVCFNQFKNFFSLNLNNNNKYFYEHNNFKNNLQVSVLLSQNMFNIKNYFVAMPCKFNFEQNSIFLNIFGVYNDFTFLSYKSNYRTLKNDWNILELFVIKFNYKFNFFLSAIKKKFVPSNWIFSEYNINIYEFNHYHLSFLNFDSKNYLNINISSFFSDIFSKNNTLFDFFNKLKKYNVFNYFSNINNLHWIF